MREVILISFLGPDQPKQFTRLMQVLDTYGLDILDVGQEVIHDQLTLGIVIAHDDSAQIALAMKDMLMVGQEIGLTVRFKPIKPEEYAQVLTQRQQARLVVTVFARQLTAGHLQAVSAVISEFNFNIESLTRLSGHMSAFASELQPARARTCVEFGIRGLLTDAASLRHQCLRLSGQLGIDIAVQEDNPYRRNRRLVCFDMDSTLIEQEVIDELAKAAGVGDAVAHITERAMQGELDFKQSFTERVALLEGLSADCLQTIACQLTITEGAHRLISILKKLGYRTAILSGGFTFFAEYIQGILGIDEVHANVLDIKDGMVTGKVVGDIVDGQRKAELLQAIAKREGIDLEQVIAVGDGANDLPMLSLAGLGVAFRAKPLVRENAEHAISSLGLDGLLYLLGVRDDDLFD